MRSLFRLVLLMAWMIPGARAAEPVVSVPELDISRYAGQWYEIARLPLSFQNKCIGEVTATYTLRDDDLIGVRNACRTANGDNAVSEGVARTVADHPGRLQVRFAPDWLSWLPVVWADYWVIALDPGYTWAVVGEPGRDYLWILSREPSMEQALFEQLKARAESMGYDLNALIQSAPLR